MAFGLDEAPRKRFNFRHLVSILARSPTSSVEVRDQDGLMASHGQTVKFEVWFRQGSSHSDGLGCEG